MLIALLLGASVPLQGATAADFYINLLRRGVSALEAGRFEDATTPLRVAAFGLVDALEQYELAQASLAIAYDRLAQEEPARDAARRVVAAERIEPHYRALPAQTRSAFETVAKKLLTGAEVATLGRNPATPSVPLGEEADVTPPPRTTSNNSNPSTTAATTPRTTQTTTPPRSTTTAPRNNPPQPVTPTRPTQTTDMTTPANTNAPHAIPVPPPSSTTAPRTTTNPPPRTAATQPSNTALPNTSTSAPATTPRNTQPSAPSTTPRNNTAAPSGTTTVPPSSTATTPRTTTQPPSPARTTVPNSAPSSTAAAPRTTTTTTTTTTRTTTTAPATTAPMNTLAPAPTAAELASRFAAAERALSRAQLPEARTIYRGLLDMRLDHDALIRVAEGFYRARDFANALAAFSRAGTLRGGEEPYRYYIAVALYETGAYVQAKRELAAALPFIEITPDVARYRAKIEAAAD
ncbi:MAG: hypothetical protein JO197_09305 [Acidobacteria bacterium]|nr:hypothetical protein [Acidobacteriota bacterium]MBV9477293.1 hypothetical protein [Acidobacteriota bacterium]